MANKDLFKQAIAEAKSIRESAIANAKEALEETLTPHLKDMLAAKLQQQEDVEETVVNEAHDDEKDEAMHPKKKDEAHSKDDHKDESIEEAPKKEDDAMEEAMDDEKDEAIEEAPKDDEDAMEEAEEENAEDDSEESEDEADEVEDAVEGDEELGDLTVDQFKDMIRDIINQEIGGGGEDLGADMDAGDIEGMGDEPELEEPAADDEEIDLDELLAELEAVSEAPKDEKDEAMHPKKKDEAMHAKKKDEAMHPKKKDEAMAKKKDEAMHAKKKDEAMKRKDEESLEETSNQVEAESDGKGYNINRTGALSEELEEALETIEQLKKDLHETNLLNSKLLYVNKIFKANTLSEAQKVNIIAAFDKAETVKEVKLVFETVSENVITTKKETVSESKVKGMASKATGTTAASKPEVINEVSDTVRRMQKLAGII